MDYCAFIRQHQELNDFNNIKPWNGSLYLPPCSCLSQTKCSEAANGTAYDFTKYTDIQLSQLVDICKYIDPSCDTFSAKSYILCKKYSLSLDFNTLDHLDVQERVAFIKQSPEFKKKQKLLQNDFKVLFPFSGAVFVFKTRYVKNNIKFDINCNMKYNYVPTSKHKSTNGIMRNCKTTKSLCTSECCKFQISMFLDIVTLDWYIKWKNRNEHSYHMFKNLKETSIGKNQLSLSVVNEINKFNKSNVSSSIQQNVLMINNDISVPIMTILNHQYTQDKEINKQKTDFEQLLGILRARKDITYFVMYAKSMHTPLLTIKKTSSAKQATSNNISVHGYVKVYQQPEKSTLPPKFDSHQQKILKQLLTTNKTSHDVEVILAVGWARDSELALFRKFPEVAKMDCTHSTNREERPLFNLVGKDTNKKLYTVMRCLLPSEKGAIFDSLLVNIIPKILGESTCSKINVIITDGDSQEIKAAQNACNIVFKNAHHINCFWHMIHNAVNGSKVVYNPSLKHIIKHWLYFTATNTETKEEQKQSISYLKVRFITSMNSFQYLSQVVFN